MVNTKYAGFIKLPIIIYHITAENRRLVADHTYILNEFIQNMLNGAEIRRASLTLPSKHETLKQCWLNAGPTSCSLNLKSS